MLQAPLRSAATRTRGAKICSPWLNASAASADKRDAQQYGQRPVFTNTEVADTIKAEMQKILDKTPGSVMPPPRCRRRAAGVTVQAPELTAGEASAGNCSVAEGAEAGCEDANSEAPRCLRGKGCMTMTLRPREAMWDESEKMVVYSGALNK